MLVKIRSVNASIIIRCYLQNIFDIVKFIASNYVIIYFGSVLGGVFFNSCVYTI